MIPIYKPFLEGNEERYVNEALSSTWISSQGAFIDRFSKDLGERFNRKYVSLCSNGTTALDLAFKAIDLREGDEVITVALTYVASTNAILMQGATPVFVDVNVEDWNMDISLLKDAVTPRTKAVLIANLYGFPVDFSAVLSFARSHDLIVIEDAAESLGAERDGYVSGSIGDISTFSFFGNKTITTGEGGAVLTNNQLFYDRIESLKNQGNHPTKRYFHDQLGYNFRMTNIQAAIGCAQLELLDEILLRKELVAGELRSSLSGKMVFQTIAPNSKPSNWIVSARAESADHLKRIIKNFKRNSIEYRPMFYPIYKLPFYNQGDLLVRTEEIYRDGICLPSYPSLSENELELIIKSILNA